jgi:hypothetical protein
MLKTIAASVAASCASVKVDSHKNVNESNDNLKSCHCGSTKFWIPVGHRDVPTSFRCSNCFPAPSTTLIARELDLNLVDLPVFQITFNINQPGCFRCGGSLITMSQNGYHCATCVAEIHPSVSDQIWEVA